MANISTLNFGQLSDLIEREFMDNLKTLSRDMLDSGIVRKNVIPHGTGDTRRMAEAIDSTQYAGVRDEGDTANQAEIQYGWEKDLQTYTIAQERSVSKHMRDVGKDNQIDAIVKNLAEVCPNTIDLDLSHRLTFAWSTSYTRTAGNTSTTIDTTVGDGLSLIATNHTLTGSSTTYSNQLPGNPQFSKGSLENMAKLFVEQTYDNLGVLRAMEPDTIITTRDPNTINQVRELLHATSNIDSSNSGTMNVYANAFKHKPISRIATTASGQYDTTKAKYWFLASSDNSSFYYSVLNEPYFKKPMDGNNGEVFSSEDWNYLVAADYGIAIVGARWIKWSKGDWS